MWSSVNESITDGTSGLLPNSSPSALVIGTCSKSLSKPITMGKNCDVQDLLGIGELPRRLADMQKTMADTSIIAVKANNDVLGSISSISQTGVNTLNVYGNSLGSSSVTISVSASGNLQTAKFDLSVSGDLSLNLANLSFEDGVFTIQDLGIALEFDENTILELGDSWNFSTTSPKALFSSLEESIENALELYSPEFVFIAQDVNADDAKLFAALSERLFEDHKPCFFLLETNLDPSLPFSEAISLKKEEFADVDGRFISVVCMDGFILTSNGKERRSPSGLCAGHITKASVNQSIGATNHFAVSQFETPDNWMNIHSRSLDESKFISLRTYAGLDNLFWANGRTFANDQSDYRFIEVVRTVFKAIRLARFASLPYIHAPGDEVGVQNLISEVRNTISSMVESTPKELDYFKVSTPDNQDIANNGVMLNIELFGIPVIRKILLNFMFKYNN